MSSPLHDQSHPASSQSLSLAATPSMDEPIRRMLSPRDVRHTMQPGHATTPFTASIPDSLAYSLAHLASKLIVPLPDLMLAALTIFLARYTGQEFMYVYGDQAALQPDALLPHTSQTFELDLSDAPSVSELVECLRPQRALIINAQPLSRSGDAQHALKLSYQLQQHDLSELTPYHRRHLDGGGLAISLFDPATQTRSEWMYALSSVEADSIGRMHGHLETMLAGMIEDPAAPMGQLPLLTPAEQQHMLVEWNNTTVSFPDDTCIHTLVEAQAQRQPDALALAYGAVRLSYRELDARANQLAHRLRQLGVAPEVLVGICAERSIELVISVLAVLKAGGAYVPLDPSYPLERLRFMVTDAQIPVIISYGARELVEQLCLNNSSDHATPPGIIAIDLEQDWPQIDHEPAHALPIQATADNLAYVIYTSGSTGKPKGVMLQHRGLVNLVLGQIAAFALTPQSRVLQFASFSFDASVSEIFTALVSGAALFLAQRETLISPDELRNVLDTHAITCVTLPPSLLAIIPATGLPALQTVVSAGERCAWEIARRWMVGRRFLNAYGPTEATIGPTAYCADQVIPGTHSVPIGKALPNVQLYILDRFGAPTLVGMPGELHIGGVGLARGYLNRPDLTAERFIDWRPSSPPSTAALTQWFAQPIRLYRTGDLARYMPDGTVEFLGRIDHQVKLRGLRIELGEIETTLREHPAIQDVLVLPIEESQGDTRLVAYMTTAAKQPIEIWPSVAEYFVYDELLYHAMTHDERRNQSYRVALQQAVAGKVALDLGTGRHAILARLALEAGARKVYAIELLEESYRYAKATIEQLGLQDRIILIHGDLRTVTLPEPVDVCVSEIVGAIGGSEGASLLLNDAWRFLKPDGVMIPARSTTQIAAISLPESLLEAPQFTSVSQHYVEQIFAQRGYAFDLRVCLRNATYDQLCSTVGTFEELDFRTQTTPEYDRWEELTITKSGRIDGFLVWLNLMTTAGEVIDILEHQHCWLPVYLPVFPEGVQASAGDRIVCQISSRLCENGLNPDYLIRGTLIQQTGAQIPFEYWSYHYKPVYQQSLFYQRLFAHEQLASQASQAPESLVEILRDYLSLKLPSYMIPAALMPMTSFPLTPNGKIDRRALPEPIFYQPARYVPHAEPRTVNERAVHAIWSQLLGVDNLGIDDDFFALGGHSLLAARAIAQINETLQRSISLRTLFEYPTIAQFTQATQAESPIDVSMSSIDLAARVALDSSIVIPTPPTFVSEPQAILLTGATGFLGAFLLEQLLQQTTATIYCLVRADDVNVATERLIGTLVDYQIWDEVWRHRIVAVAGDLHSPRFGVHASLYMQLAETIECIYHAGAQVHYLSSYTALEQVNVQGTVSVIEFATQSRVKPIHYISSIAVAMSGNPDTPIHADDELPECTSASGYIQSKWVAEGILRLARARGLPVSIYRPGRISGHTQTGVSNSNDFFLRLLAGCIQLGFAPDIPIVENLIPVDYAVQSIVALARQSAAINHTFHILNPQLVEWDWVITQARLFGYELNVVAYSDWYRTLMQMVPQHPDNALHSLRFLIPEDPTQAEWMLAWSAQICEVEHTQEGLSARSIVCPAIDTLVFQRMLHASMQRGLFPKLQASQALDLVSSLQLVAA